MNKPRAPRIGSRPEDRGDASPSDGPASVFLGLTGASIAAVGIVDARRGVVEGLTSAAKGSARLRSPMEGLAVGGVTLSNRDSYEYDVFLSYRRRGEWPAWVKKHFYPLLEHWLGEELHWQPRVYWDERFLEAGDDYPDELAAALSASAVLVPLFSRQYFSSPWCRTEFGLMRVREDMCHYRTPQRRDVLIVAATIHDGEDFDRDVQRMQAANLAPYANTRIAHEGGKAEELADRIRAELAPPVAAAIRAAPPRSEDWLVRAAEAMDKAFSISPPRQMTVPSFAP